MKDYSSYAILEAVQIEVAEKFIKSVKNMDAEVAIRRLHYIMNANGGKTSALDIMGQFNSVVGHITSADK